MSVPSMDIPDEIEKILKELPPKNRKKVREYIKGLLLNLYNSWEQGMGEDL